MNEWSHWKFNTINYVQPVVQFLLVERLLETVNFTLEYINSALGKLGMRFAHFQLLAQLLLRFLVVVFLLPVMLGLQIDFCNSNN